MQVNTDGILFSPAEVTNKLDEIAAAHNLNLQDLDTTIIHSFCQKNRFRNTKKFTTFIDNALRSAALKAT